LSHTLLVADDSPTTHRLVGLTFTPQGIDVVSVSDGEQARELVKARRPDLVLAGTTLPRVDGYELAEFIRTDPSLAGVPVLLLASPFDAVDKERVRRAGAAGVLVKPLDPDAAVKWVKDLLASAVRPDPSASPSPGISPATDEYFEQLDRALAARETPGADAGIAHDGESALPQPRIPPPEVADAFEIFFAAEQSGEPPPPMPAPVADDANAQMMTQVRDRLQDAKFDEAVRDIVVQVAERLVREEIARIRRRAEAHGSFAEPGADPLR
jgi:CheY-like chemotaxis protein